MDTLAFCSTKNEGPYLLEWISFYRNLGFDKIVIATNDNSDRSVDILQKVASAFPWFSTFEHTVSASTAPQFQAYRIFKNGLDISGFKGYIGLFDIDEFLMLPQGASLHDFLKSYKDVDAIFINWRMYGSSGHLVKPPGLVIESYPRCAPISFSEHRKFKSIFRYDSCVRALGVHWPYYTDEPDRRIVFTDGKQINPLILSQKPYYIHSRICIEGVQLNHYSIKSKAEYEVKKLRGRGAMALIKTRGREIRHNNRYFEEMDRNEVLLPMPSDLVLGTKKLMAEIYTRAGISEICPPEYFGINSMLISDGCYLNNTPSGFIKSSADYPKLTFPLTSMINQNPKRHQLATPSESLDLEPRFNSEMRDYFKNRVASSSVYLEYGCGGSTVYAAHAKGERLIVSCESDPNYIDTVKGHLSEEAASRVRFVHIDLGPVGPWGFPNDAAMHNRGWQYQQRPWKIINRIGVSPDFILIDGRFRSACFLTCLVYAEPGVEILVDDYLGRKYHQVISKYCTPTRYFGTSAQFHVPKAINFRSLALDLAASATTAV